LLAGVLVSVKKPVSVHTYHVSNIVRVPRRSSQPSMNIYSTLLGVCTSVMRVSEMAPTPASYHSGSLISQFLFSENQRSGSSIFGGEWKSITSILPQKKNYNERNCQKCTVLCWFFHETHRFLEFLK